MPPQTSADLIQTIAALSPPSCSQVDAPTAKALREATRSLILAMQREGRLAESPMQLALTRDVELHHAAATRRLRGKRVLVTGGSGCVGTRLRELLAGFEPAVMVNLDIAAHHGEGQGITTDIRDLAALDAAFSSARPDIVFHLASIREPGRAELEVQNAISTNVFGTANIINMCRKHGVSHAVYSSTGKCYAYLTDHVYTASKKLAEATWMAAARQAGPTMFSMTRFTHVLENGIVARDIAEGIEAGLVGLHGPDRHFNIQNLRQATHLLVNALALAGEQAADTFWSAVDLGWPVNTLELALFEIARSGRDAGVHFLGVPKGYDESFFRGQFDWSGEYDYHPLVNALEAPTSFIDDTGTMINARVAHCPQEVLDSALQQLRCELELAAVTPATQGDVATKNALLHAVTQVTTAVLSRVRCSRLIDILWWGAAPELAGSGTRFHTLIRILADSVSTQLDRAPTHLDAGTLRKLSDIAETLSGMSGLTEQAINLAASARLGRAA
jgi:nucleoside-diphosphate-sugar epimerase